MADAEALLAAVARDVLTDVTEAAVLELAWGRERHVKTAAGEKMYHVPIGSLITFHMRQKAREHHGTAAEAKVHVQQETGTSAVSDHKPSTAPEVQEAKKGAAAIHPGVNVPIRRPGDTISGHAYRHVPKPTPGLVQPVPEEPKTRELRGPFGNKARVTGDKVEVQSFLGEWRDVEEPKFREQILSTWHDAGTAEPAAPVAPGVTRQVRSAVLEQLNAKAEARASARAEREAARAKAEREATAYKPLTDSEYAQHVQEAEDIVARELAAGHSTDKTEANAAGAWKPERAELHNQIVRKMLKGAVGVPSQGKAIIAGGLGGAGKSTVLSKHAGINQRDYLTINPDDIKEEMAKRGMVPEVKGLSPMEASPLVHEEASHIANLVAHQAYDRKKNVIWDITMSSPGSVRRRLSEMRKAGYHDVRAVFVHIPVETSVQRARDRHRRGLESFRQGQGAGGRLVPSGVIRATARAGGSNASKDTFTALKDEFDGYKEYDNSGSKPKLVTEHSPPEKHADVMSAEEIIRRVKAWGGGQQSKPKPQPPPKTVDSSFLQSHYSGWRSELSDSEEKGLHFYQSPGFALMNGQLRGQDANSLKSAEHASDKDLVRARKASKDLTAAIRKAPPLPSSVTVYRGFDAKQFGDLEPGQVVTDKGFTSTAITNDAGAVGRAGEVGQAEVLLPSGTKAAAGSVRELILAPNSRFRVVSVQKTGKETHVKLELVP